MENRVKVTVASIRHLLDLEKVHQILQQVQDLNGYERRLVALGVQSLNADNQFWLPPKAKDLLYGDDLTLVQKRL